MRETRSEATKDIQNKEFWDELSEVFALTFEMLHEMAEDEGIDLDAINTEEIEYRKVDDPEIENHPVIISAEAYFESSRNWLDNYKETFRRKSNEYKDLVEKEINTDRNRNNLLIFKDLYEIINWYHSMILVKSKRAVMSALDDWGVDEIQNDMNGTAKVVLSCIERSTFAWSGILKQMPEQEDSALKNLANLQLLKVKIQAYFPNAEKFIRPGFDENIGK